MAGRAGEDRSVLEVRMSMLEWMKRLGMDPAFGERHLNEGFSGGERKRNEILQMAMLEPDLAVLDETDSGLDIDALREVSEGVQTVRTERGALGVLLVTHYTRILELLRPDVVHVLVGGRIVERGGPELAGRLEEEGYEPWRT
jgi:Fe-S cluster assembly ATP-binding protein